MPKKKKLAQVFWPSSCRICTHDIFLLGLKSAMADRNYRRPSRARCLGLLDRTASALKSLPGSLIGAIESSTRLGQADAQSRPRLCSGLRKLL